MRTEKRIREIYGKQKEKGRTTRSRCTGEGKEGGNEIREWQSEGGPESRIT